MIFTIYNLLIEYLKYDVNVQMSNVKCPSYFRQSLKIILFKRFAFILQLDIEKASSLEFPAICNQNMLRWSEAQYVVENILNNTQGWVMFTWYWSKRFQSSESL